MLYMNNNSFFLWFASVLQCYAFELHSTYMKREREQEKNEFHHKAARKTKVKIYMMKEESTKTMKILFTLSVLFVLGCTVCCHWFCLANLLWKLFFLIRLFHNIIFIFMYEIFDWILPISLSYNWTFHFYTIPVGIVICSFYFIFTVVAFFSLALFVC